MVKRTFVDAFEAADPTKMKIKMEMVQGKGTQKSGRGQLLPEARGTRLMTTSNGEGQSRISKGDDDDDNDNNNDNDNDNNNNDDNNGERQLSLRGLRVEVDRQISRVHKKIFKANEKRGKSGAGFESKSESKGQRAVGGDATATETGTVISLQERLGELTEFQSLLRESKKVTKEIKSLSESLKVGDKPPSRPPRGPPKKKGPKSDHPRRPFREYLTADGVSIYVGKRATDNDDLSTNKKWRTGREWWMHSQNCPGSHVVIKSEADHLPQEVILDAASLAARQCKLAPSNNVSVTLTRVANVSKPAGFVPGMVRLGSGKIQTIQIDLRREASRLQRLDATVKV